VLRPAAIRVSSLSPAFHFTPLPPDVLGLGTERHAPECVIAHPHTPSVQFPSAHIADATTQLVLAPEETPSSAVQVQNSFVYGVAPPAYPPIAGARAREKGVAHNLMSHFVDMTNPAGFGVVMDLGEFMSWIAS
jgi:hypothetical protein